MNINRRDFLIGSIMLICMSGCSTISSNVNGSVGGYVQTKDGGSYSDGIISITFPSSWTYEEMGNDHYFYSPLHNEHGNYAQLNISSVDMKTEGGWESYIQNFTTELEKSAGFDVLENTSERLIYGGYSGFKSMIYLSAKETGYKTDYKGYILLIEHGDTVYTFMSALSIDTYLDEVNYLNDVIDSIAIDRHRGRVTT